MEFKDVLNKYIESVNCTSKELANTSNVAPSIISRYRNGYSVPKYDSRQINSIIDSLYLLAKKKKLDISKEKIHDDLYKFIPNVTNYNYDIFRNNINTIITSLNINVNHLSKFIGYDASFISKIRSGKRKPKNVDDFTKAICKYIVYDYNDFNSKKNIASLINCDIKIIERDDKYFNKLYTWITNNKITQASYIDKLLKVVNDFNLEEYLNNFNSLDKKLEKDDNDNTKSLFFYGIDNIRKAQMMMLKEIILSDSLDSFYIYSDMPISEINNDLEYANNFMIAMGLILKKGIKINIIHDVDRSLDEMLQGFTTWLPLYMSGNVNPYYFKKYQNNIYSHFDCVAGTIALSGECITNFFSDARYYLTRKSDEVKYYRKKAKNLFSKALPLMNIYKENDKVTFDNFVRDNLKIKGVRKNILSKLPTYTLSDSLLNKIFDNNKVSSNDRRIIVDAINDERKRVLKILSDNKIINDINILSKEEFDKSNYTLSLSKIFYDKNIKYTYNDYLEHIELTKKLQEKYSNYSCNFTNNNQFKNINIYIIEDRQVIISKENNPTIHFVIYHPKLIEAISKFKAI